jgi:DNA-binding transcriptional MerR regulator
MFFNNVSYSVTLISSSEQESYCMQTKSPRPIDIAKKIGMSTSALRHYEAWGIIPPVPRSENDYRLYSKEHEAYFVCIRSMNTGFCMALTGKVMRLLIQRDVKNAGLF